MTKDAAAGSPIPPPLLYLSALAGGIALDHLLHLPPLVLLAGDWQFVLAFVLATTGLAILMGAAGRFRRAHTAVEPWKPTSAIVTTGIYAHSRNPMYLGLALVFLGIALAFASWGALALLPLVLLWIDRVQIRREERYLDEKFGQHYRNYKAAVRRWF